MTAVQVGPRACLVCGPSRPRQPCMSCGAHDLHHHLAVLGRDGACVAQVAACRRCLSRVRVGGRAKGAPLLDVLDVCEGTP